MAKSLPTNSSWGGRFNAAPTNSTSEYTDSQHFDRQLYAQDIQASCAHARMLGRQGIISPKEAEAIIQGLKQIFREIKSGEFIWKSSLEDVHMNIENRLTELIGEAGKKLHTGRSRNDQVGLTFRLYVAEICERWLMGCAKLCDIIHQQASRHKNDIMPGFTHMQPAQPVTVAQHLLAYAGMLRRDAARLGDSLTRIRISPLGAAALAGSTYPLDPESVAREVGFNGIYDNSMDAVSDRDFVLEALFDASLIMEHLSRLCEELIIWASPAFGFLSLPDEYSTGSSIMPQKKNPDVAELMRGKTGRVYGALISLLTVMKGLPLAYNRDMQEDKECFLDTAATVESSLNIMAGMLATVVFRPERMANACKAGFLNATEIADYLSLKGIPFRDAHHIAGRAVALAEKKGVALEELSLEEFKTLHEAIEEDIYQALDYENCIKRRETPGGTGPVSIARQLQKLRQWLDSILPPDARQE